MDKQDMNEYIKKYKSYSFNDIKRVYSETQNIKLQNAAYLSYMIYMIKIQS